MNELRVTLLGSGSPSPNLARCHPAALVEWGESGRMLVDAGDGVVAQLLKAGADITTVEHIALTHMHWDHILGYPAFIWGSWTAGRSNLTVFGPEGTTAMHERLVGFYDDQARWAVELGYRPEGWEVDVRDIEPGWSIELDGCTITAGAVVHPPMPSVGYRFEYEGRSLVISGDTTACDELVDFSFGADMLVVDACAVPAPPTAPPHRQLIRSRLHRFHATPDECLSMARRAGVAHVVLTHHLPDVTPSYERGDYEGVISIGEDLARFTV